MAVERPGGKSVGQRPTVWCAGIGLQRKGGNMVDNIKGCKRNHLRWLISVRKCEEGVRAYIFKLGEVVNKTG